MEPAAFPPIETLSPAQRKRLAFAMLPPNLTFTFTPGSVSYQIITPVSVCETIASKDRLTWILWMSWAHDWLFSEQDKRIVEAVTPGPEVLSRTDVGVVAWRRFAAANARRPLPARRAGNAAAE